MNTRLARLTAVLAVVLGAHLTLADNQAIRIESLKGTVHVQRHADPSHQWQPLTSDTTLQPGDLIRTGSTGSVTLRLADSVTTISPDSLFEVGTGLPAPAPPLPPGVSQDRWFSLGPNAGIFLSTPGQSSRGSIDGALFLRVAGAWTRIHLTPPPQDPRQVVPAR